MMKLKTKIFLLFYVVVFSCVEPVPLETENFEDILVIDAVLTDELKHHEIFLTRTAPLIVDDKNIDPPPIPESNADVRIVDSAGNVYLFEEESPGKYISVEEFKARPQIEYQLKVTTANGMNYSSEPTTLAEGSEIDELYAERTEFTGMDGVALLINNSSPAGATNFYRYEYEETYKIVSALSYPKDLIVIGGNSVEEVQKTEEETICYNTVSSNEIILGNTNSLSENSLNRFLVRFVDSENPIIGSRYSILVKQYAISPEVYHYYETLKKFSESESIFSQNQPGFIPGNIRSENNSSEKVVGIFSVASVSSKRIYFNYRDFFSKARPTFGPNCRDPQTVGKLEPLQLPMLISMLLNNYGKYYGRQAGFYLVVPTGCMDCKVYGTTEVPEFWEEE